MLPLEFYLSGIVVIVIIVAVFLFKVKKPTVMIHFPYHDEAEKLSKDVFAEDLVKENRRSTDKGSRVLVTNQLNSEDNRIYDLLVPAKNKKPIKKTKTRITEGKTISQVKNIETKAKPKKSK